MEIKQHSEHAITISIGGREFYFDDSIDGEYICIEHVNGEDKDL